MIQRVMINLSRAEADWFDRTVRAAAVMDKASANARIRDELIEKFKEQLPTGIVQNIEVYSEQLGNIWGGNEQKLTLTFFVKVKEISLDWISEPWISEPMHTPEQYPAPLADEDDDEDDEKEDAVINQDPPTFSHSHSTEESNMGFTRKGGSNVPRNRSLPAKVQDADFTQIHKYHQYLLADMLGCFGAIKAAAPSERATLLKEQALRNLETAQRFYELICLRKDGETKPTTTAEEKYVELLGSILNKYSDDLDKAGEAAVVAAIEELDKGVIKYQPKLIDYAKKAIDEAAEKRAPIIIKDSGKARKIEGVLPAEFQRMVELASARIPIMLVGPAGCGKTYLGEKLAEALDMEFSDQSCSEGMSESVFNGRLLPIGKGGEFQHVASPFMQRYESGGVMLLDEIDAGDPNLFTYINKAIANSSYTVDQRWTKPVVKKHKNFVLVAAANTFGHGADAMYVGRNQLDAATLDRFKVGLLTMDYSREVEESLAPTQLLSWAWGVRDKIRTNKLRRIMSTRVIKDLGVMTERYNWARPEWERAYFTGWTEAERKLVA